MNIGHGAEIHSRGTGKFLQANRDIADLKFFIFLPIWVLGRRIVHTRAGLFTTRT
ncbi:hypothetical protein [Paraburkholderia caffeinilytica]|jgi:hypothetical protein|uniref:hypothetical protein n=1 Tax=Paraburkholderia caffeinilytica TaxID=1761016 RepID=UPI0013BE8D5A|nr:hypothetical protein [Paraburkholderia caffeinilytica]CAB3784784.1 hypothetical protein LMG28690_01859 [Paraburkholderia caffeinilytica]